MSDLGSRPVQLAAALPGVDPWEALEQIGLAIADAAAEAEADDNAGRGPQVAPLERAMLRIGKVAARALASRDSATPPARETK
jgi:hypothetical protein